MAYTGRLNKLRTEEEERALDEALNIIGKRRLATSAPRAAARGNVLALADETAAAEQARREEEARLTALRQFEQQQYNAEMERRRQEETAAAEQARRNRAEQLANITFNRGQDVSNLDILQARAQNPRLNNVQNLSLERAIVDLNQKRKAQREAQQWEEEEKRLREEQEAKTPEEKLREIGTDAFRRGEERRESGTEKTKGTQLGSLANEAKNLEAERRNLDNFKAMTPAEEEEKRREYAQLERDENRLAERAEKERLTRKQPETAGTTSGMSANDAMRALDEIEREHEQFISKRTPTWMLELEQQETQQERAEAEAALAKDPEAEKKYRTLHDYSVYKPVNVMGQDTDRYKTNLIELRILKAENPTQKEYAEQAEAELTRRINLIEDPDKTIKENEAKIRELEEMELSGGYFGEGTPKEKITAAKENLERQNKLLEAYKDSQNVTKEEIEKGKLISEGKGEKLSGKITGKKKGFFDNDLKNTGLRTADQIALSMALDAAADYSGGKGTSDAARQTELGRMNEQERNLYYAYLARDAEDGGNRAAEYRKLMQKELSAREAENYENYVEAVTETAPAAMKVAQMVQEPGKLIGTAYDIISRANGTNDPNSPYYLSSRTQDTINQTVSGLIDENVKNPTWNKVLHTVDEAVTNIMNNGFRNMIGGMLGLGPKTSTIAMGLGEYGSAAREAAGRLESSYLASLTPGEDARKVKLMGAAGAIGEMAGEFLPTEHWFGNIRESTKGVGQFLVNMLKQTATEIPGEILTDVIDKAADNYIMEDMAEDEKLKRDLIFNGIPEKEADRLVKREFGREILNTIVVTGLSSGVSSAYTMTIGNKRVNKAQRILDDYTSSHGMERIKIEGLDDLYADGTRQTYEKALDAAYSPDTAKNSYSTPEAAAAAAEKPSAESEGEAQEKIDLAIRKAAQRAQEVQLQEAAAAAEAETARANVQNLADEMIGEKVKPMTEEQIRERDREMERVRGRTYVEQLSEEEVAQMREEAQRRAEKPQLNQAAEFAPTEQETAADEGLGDGAGEAPAEQPAEQPAAEGTSRTKHIALKTKAGKEVMIEEDDEGTRKVSDEAGEHIEFDTAEDPDSAPQVILRKTHGKDAGTAKAIAVAIESADENQDKNSIATEAESAYTAAAEGEEISDAAKETIYSELTEEQLRAAEEQGRRDREERQRMEYETTKRNAGKYGFRLADDKYRVGLNVESLSDENANDGAKRLQMMALDEFGKAYGIDIRVHNTLEEGKANAKYRVGSGVINVALDAEDGGILRAASHDLFHYIAEWSAEGAWKIRNFVIDTLNNAKDYNLEQRRAELQAENERNGIEEDVDEEIVADAMLDVIGREGVIAKVFGDDGRGGGIVEKIKEGIDKFRNFLHSVLNRIGRNNKEAAALKDDEAYMDRLAVLVDEATKDATARRRMKERTREITFKRSIGKYSESDLMGIAQAAEQAKETGEAELDNVLETYGAYLLQEKDDPEEAADKRKKVKRLFAALDEGQNLAKAAETAELDLDEEERTFFGWAQRERSEDDTVERERRREGKRLPVEFSENEAERETAAATAEAQNTVALETENEAERERRRGEKMLPVEFSRKEEERDTDGETADEWYDRVLKEEEEEEEGEAWKTRTLFTKIVNLLKYGRKYANDEGTPNVGSWVDRVPQIVDEIKHRGFSTIGDDQLTGMIRKMYTALDDTIARGGNITPSQIFNYAEEIAEKVAKKARYAEENAETEEKSDFRKFLHETVFRINPELKQYVKSTYGGIWQLNKEYRGITSFTWAERGNTYDADGHRKGTHPIDDLYVEGWRGRGTTENDFFNQDEIANREDQFDHFLEMARWSQKEETTYSWAGMKESDYIEDITNAIVMDYLDLGVDKMLTGTDEKQLDKYRKMSRELQKQYRAAKKQLEQQAREEIASVVGEDPAQIDLTKRGALKEKYTAQLQVLAQQYAAEAQTEAVNMQLEAARQMDEAAQTAQEKGALLAQISDLRAALNAEHESRQLEWQKQEDVVKQSINEEIRKRAERTGLERNIKRNITNMQRRLQQPSDKMHIADEYRGGIANALKLLGETIFQPKPDAKTGWTYAFSTLRDVIARLEAEKDDSGISLMNIDPDLQTDLSNLEEALTYTTKDGEKKMRHSWRNMSTENLKELDDIITRLRHTIDSADDALKLARGQKISDLAAELHASAESKENDKTRSGLRQSLYQYTNKSLRDPVRFFKDWARRIGGTSGQTIWKALRDAERDEQRNVKAAEELFKEVTHNEGRRTGQEWDIRRWHGDSAASMEIQLESGETIQLTAAQIMYLYLAQKRNQARNHILGSELKNGERVGGGITIAKTNSKQGTYELVEPIKITEEDLKNIIKLLTPEQKQCADEMQKKIFREFGSRLGNEVSKAMYGYTKYKEENYVPIKIWEGGKSVTSGSENQNPFYRTQNQGFTKQLVQNANAPLQVTDLFDIAMEHTAGMIKYHAWTETLSDIVRLLNYKFQEEHLVDQVDDSGAPYTTTVKETTGSVSADIQRVLGRDGKAYLTQLLKDINGLTTDSIEAEAAKSMKLFSRFKGAAVAWNISTIMKQPLSIVRAYDVIPMHYFLKGTNVLSKTERDRITGLMEKYAPIYTWKQYGNFMLDTGKSIENILLPQMENWRDRFTETGMKGAGAADNITWMNIWHAAERMIKSQRSDLQPGSEAFYQAVGEKFEQCIDETQVVDSILHRTEIMRSKSSVLKMLTSFMGEPLKTYNMFMDKLNAFAEDRSMENMKSLLKTSNVLLNGSITVAIVSALISALRHWDDDKPLGENTWERFIGDYEGKNWLQKIVEATVGSNLAGELNLLNSIPFARDIMEVISGYDVTRTDLDSFTDLWKYGSKMILNLTGEKDNTTFFKRTVDFAGAIANIFGVPAGNILKEWQYLNNEAARTVEAAGANTLEWQYATLRMMKKLGTDNKNDFIALMVKAQDQGDEDTAKHIMKDLTDAGVTDEQISERLKKIRMGQILGDGESVSAENAVGNWYQALKDGDKDRAKEIYQGLYKYYKSDTIKNAIVAAVKNDPRTTEINEARMKGNSDPMKKWLEELRKMGVDSDLAIKGINNNYNALDKAKKAENGTKTAATKATETAKPQVSATDAVYTYSDLYSAVSAGTTKDAQEIVSALRSQGKKDDNIRTQLTKNFKPDYLDAYKRGDKAKMQQLESKLLGLGIGYTAKSFEGWIKDYEKKK